MPAHRTGHRPISRLRPAIQHEGMEDLMKIVEKKDKQE